MTIDNKLINSHLKRILTSRHFNKSKISCDLLTYLVNASIEGKNPKEFTIGIELFGKKYDGDEAKQDSNIRVYIHNVRKKLKDYYSEEGKKDPVIFEIEKGKYRVNFISRKEKKAATKTNYFIPFLISSSIFILLLGWLLLTNKNQENPWQKLPIWQQYADNNKETLLVLGDYFVFSGTLPTGNIGVYRDFSINSEVEYEHLLDKNPELIKDLSKSPLTYLSKMSVFCQNDILKVFAKTGGEVNVKLASDIQPDDLKEFNIVFIGNYKNMGLFENIVKELHFNFGIASGNNQYIFPTDPCAEVYTPENGNLKQNDYATVIYTEGYADNYYLFFLSTQDIGNISTVNLFTDPEYVRSFTDEQLKNLNSPSFKTLYKVEGIDKTSLSFELIRVE